MLATPPARRLCLPGCKQWPLPSALGLGCRDLPLTTVLQPALLRPPWGARDSELEAGWEGVGCSQWVQPGSPVPDWLAGLPQQSHPRGSGQGIGNSTFQKHFTEKRLVLKLLGLSSAESCTIPDYFLTSLH